MQILTNSLLSQLIDQVIVEFPAERVAGLEQEVMKNLLMTTLLEQHASMSTMSHEQQVAILLAAVGKLTIDNLALNYKLMQKI